MKTVDPNTANNIGGIYYDNVLGSLAKKYEALLIFLKEISNFLY